MASGRKVIFGTPGDPFAEFANDHDVLIPEDDPNKVYSFGVPFDCVSPTTTFMYLFSGPI